MSRRLSGKAFTAARFVDPEFDEKQGLRRDKSSQRPAQGRLAIGRLAGADLSRTRSRRNGQRAAVDAAAKSAPGEIAKIAADRVLRGYEGLGERCREDSPLAGEALEDLLLSFGGEN